MSRAQEWVFRPEDRQCPRCAKFVDLMRRLEVFTGVEVLTYCLMSNHFHLLLREPKAGREPVPEEEILRRLAVLNGAEASRELAKELKRWREEMKLPRVAEEMLDRLRARMGDVSIFLKELKGRFAQWYNLSHEREGVFWKERFKSVLVEDGLALLTMANYIDLNPVRGGLVADPKDHRWSGYGEAVGGHPVARQGLRQILASQAFGAVRQRWEAAPWREVGAHYRKGLYLDGKEEEGRTDLIGGGHRRGFDAQSVEEVLQAGGHLSPAQALRCRIRYFNDGLALGSREFIEQVFRENLRSFGPMRTTGARKLKGMPWEDLRGMRELRKNPTSPAAR